MGSRGPPSEKWRSNDARVGGIDLRSMAKARAIACASEGGNRLRRCRPREGERQGGVHQRCRGYRNGEGLRRNYYFLTDVNGGDVGM